ncbi:MAG: chaperone NapD [Desulfobulbaceae bacterium]|jgi:nitrate reductase NapD|nr:chaperone NapD [Desulfobulbaceae bacterium]
MPIAGAVITVKPEQAAEAARDLAAIAGVESQGGDGSGHLVVVLESASLKAMENLVERINALPQVVNVGLTYINVEDEATDGAPPM